MQIEIDDAVNMRHTITTTNLDIAGKWLADKAQELTCADTRMMPYRLTIYPTTKAEQEAIGNPRWNRQHVSQDELLEFAAGVLAYAEKVGEMENANTGE